MYRLGEDPENANKFLAKGSLVFIEGELYPDKILHTPKMWTDDAGGVHSTYDVTVRDIKYLSKAEATDQAEQPAEVAQEEIPF